MAGCDLVVDKWPQRDGAMWRCHSVDFSSCLLLFFQCPTDTKLTRNNTAQSFLGVCSGKAM